jgi:hypothetical protein
LFDLKKEALNSFKRILHVTTAIFNLDSSAILAGYYPLAGEEGPSLMILDPESG